MRQTCDIMQNSTWYGMNAFLWFKKTCSIHFSCMECGEFHIFSIVCNTLWVHTHNTNTRAIYYMQLTLYTEGQKILINSYLLNVSLSIKSMLIMHIYKKKLLVSKRIKMWWNHRKVFFLKIHRNCSSYTTHTQWQAMQPFVWAYIEPWAEQFVWFWDRVLFVISLHFSPFWHKPIIFWCAWVLHCPTLAKGSKWQKLHFCKRAKCVCHFHWHQWNIMMSYPTYLLAGWVFMDKIWPGRGAH